MLEFSSTELKLSMDLHVVMETCYNQETQKAIA